MEHVIMLDADTYIIASNDSILTLMERDEHGWYKSVIGHEEIEVVANITKTDLLHIYLAEHSHWAD